MTDSGAIYQAWIEADRQRRVRFSKIGCVLGLILVPAGVSLDWLVYPDRLGQFLVLRLVTDVAMLAVLIAHFSRVAPRLVHGLTLAWLAAPQVMICFMIYLTQGHASTYYAGLNLAILGIGVLLPVTVWEVAILAATTITLYVLSCLAHSGMAIDWGMLYNNLYFLATTSVISATAVFFNRRRRFSEFRLNFELETRNKELSELDRLKSEFFANVSHELRTPLTLILAPVEDMLDRRQRLPAEVADHLSIIRNNAVRLLRLVNDLLDVIRLEEGRVELELRPLDFTSLLGSIADSMGPLADSRGIELVKNLPDETIWVRGDRSALEKIFFNLLSNAFKFTNEQGRVSVVGSVTGETLMITVADTGIGIGEEHLPYVFDRFRQADSSTTRRYQGTGLGLALVKELSERHGGNVSIHSKLGEGTAITVTLPAMSADEVTTADEDAQIDHGQNSLWLELANQQSRETAASTKLAPANDDHSGDISFVPKDATVLVADDEPDMRRYLVDLLSREYHVLQAVDGRQALETAQTYTPDLMVLDLMLPEMDGLDVCQRLKAADETRSIRIVLLTARADEASKLTALERGADDFLTKPFNGVEVQTRLRNLLRNAELERDLKYRNEELQTTLNELQQTQQKLIQSEKLNALGRLSAGLLHEVNNPLNYALTALDIAKNDPAIDQDEELKDMLGDVDEGMQRIRAIVTELRAFAYPSKGEMQTFSLQDAVDSAQHIVAHEIKGIPIVRELGELPMVRGSRNHVSQVLMNLLTNAARAVESVQAERTGEIRIRARATDNRVYVSVRDNGTGIPADKHERIFDPFYTTRDVGEGMGMGLSICQTIIRNQGGDLKVDSEEGAWTEFTFDLQIADQQDETTEEALWDERERTA